MQELRSGGVSVAGVAGGALVRHSRPDLLPQAAQVHE